MKILVAGCSFSSGWGFPQTKNNPIIWANQLQRMLGCQIDNVSQTSASNSDIFLSTLKQLRTQDYNLVLVQWSGLNRITVSPSPLATQVLLHNDNYLREELKLFSAQEISGFLKILTTLNQDWKHFNQLIDMIRILQSFPNVYFINGLLPWSESFFNNSVESFPTDVKLDEFTQHLIQVDQYPDQLLTEWLLEVKQQRSILIKKNWINLTTPWKSSKIDTLSAQDQHPGPLSQQQFANQILNFLKDLHV